MILSSLQSQLTLDRSLQNFAQRDDNRASRYWPWPPPGHASQLFGTLANMHSTRFNRPVVVTHHAAHRMAERRVTPELLLRVIDEGQTRYSDDVRLWVWLDVPGRDDNLLCAVLVLESAVIVKTVMHHWELMP